MPKSGLEINISNEIHVNFIGYQNVEYIFIGCLLMPNFESQTSTIKFYLTWKNLKILGNFECVCV